MTVSSGEPAPDLAAAVRLATMTLAAAGIASAPVDAVLLAAYLLDVDTSEVRRRMVVGGSGAPGGYAELVSRRASRVPLQHLTGQAPFRTLTLQVGPGVFVPRPETELIVDHVLRELSRLGRTHPVVVDLCTGSGAIALSVKTEAPSARVVAVELSPSAVQWATLNRDALGLDVEIVTADARSALPELGGCVDVVVCNPPYIPEGATPVDPEVRDYDPHEALYGGGARGLDLPLAIAGHAAVLLRSGGALVMEHADVQGATLPPELAATGLFTQVVDHPDLVGRPRHVVARR